MVWRLWKTFVALILFIALGIHGGNNLLGWYSTGEHWANFKNRGEPNNYKLITFSDHPLNLAGLLVIDVAFVVTGCAAIIVLIALLLGLHKGAAEK
jgi:uncharacterized membrane protein